MPTRPNRPAEARDLAPDAAPQAAAAAGALPWWATIFARGEVTAKVRLRRTIFAMLAAMGMALLLLIMLIFLQLEPWPDPPAPVVEDAVAADEIPEELLRRPIRVRVERAVVAGPSAQPADAIIHIPPDRAMQLRFWSLHCAPSRFPIVQATGSSPPGTSVIRIPKVPPTRCDVTFVGGSVQVSVTAGSVRRCTWNGQLVCR